ncbi:integrase, catalytic region, zinc finger, CCHC-type containing protein [Tanacetum coccineum]
MNIDQDRHMLMVDDNVGNQFRENANGLSVVPGIANQHGNRNVVAARAKGNSNEINGNQIRCYNCRGEGHYASNCTVKPRKRDAAYLQKQLQIAQKDEVWIQLNYEEFDFMAAAGAYDEIEKVTTNCNLQDNLQQASTLGTQSDKAPIYDLDGSDEVRIVNQVDARDAENFEIQFLKEAAKFVQDFKSLAKEADESLAKHKALELEIERLLRAVVSQDIMSIVQNSSVYVNGMKSRKKNQSANVSKSANQKKHKAQVWKPKNVGSKERFASPKPSKPRSCLRWSPTGRLFDLKGKIITSSESESQSDFSKGDNAFTSNPQEPIRKRFPSSTFSMTGCQNWFDTLLIPLLSEYKSKDKASHGDNEYCNPFFKEKGSVRFSALYLQKKRNLLVFTSADMIVMTSMVELESLFGHLFDELSNGENQVVSKSSDVTTADAFDKRQQQQDSTSSTSSLATTISADGNFDL